MKIPILHKDIIHSLREFADYLERQPIENRISVYSEGGYVEQCFMDGQIWIRADVGERW